MGRLNLLYGSSKRRSRAFGRIIGATAIGSAALTFIASPRPTRPHVLPLPHFDVEELEETEEREIGRAEAVSNGELSAAVRAVGEQLRRVGAQVYQRTHIDQKLLGRLRRDATQLVASDKTEPLLQLRALQSQLFLAATHSSLKAGQPNTELQELGGEFGRLLFSAWVDSEGRCTLDDPALRLMFRSHFNQLTGLGHDDAFKLNLEEIRRYYGALIEHPPVGIESAELRAAARLKYAQALSQSDSQFEADALLGMLHLQMGRPGHAIRYFDQYLKQHPSHAFSHIVRGHLKFALQKASALDHQP